jgi:CPA1 family monovalent cation:H+ antiporter
MTAETSFILLFSIATAVAIAVRRLRVPYTVALVLVGLVLGSLNVLEAPHLTKELLFALILPGLIFEAAFNLDVREFWNNRLAIGALAVPGVVAAIALTAAIVTPIMVGLGLDPTFDWRYGLVFGALIAATDPIAVVALFKQLHVGHRLSVLVEGESLLNDGTSVVFFTLILAFVTGTATTATTLVTQFAAIVGGGALVGAAIGIAVTQVTKRIDEPVIEITLTVIAAYGSFVVGEQLHYSGVIATVVAGMLCGSYGWEVGMSPSTQLAVTAFWEYVAFALNSIVFLLIGFEVRFPVLLGAAGLIGVAYLGTLLARFGVVTSVVALLRPTRERIPRSWTAVLTWGGLRGALSMVLALALPFDFPHRSQLVTMTFGVVLLSLVVQGLTMSTLLRRLGLVEEHRESLMLDRVRGDLRAVDRGMAEIERMRRLHAAPQDVLDALEQRLLERREGARRHATELHLAQADLRRDDTVRAVRRLLLAEKAELTDALGDGEMRVEVAQELGADVDARLARLDAGEFAAPDELLLPPAREERRAPERPTGDAGAAGEGGDDGGPGRP